MFHFQIISEYYDELIGKSNMDDEMMTFISNYFTPTPTNKLEDDLQFAIIETTSRNNRQHIGQTKIFGGPQGRKKNVLDTYEKTILSMLDAYDFNPAFTDEWYKRDHSYILSGINPKPLKPVIRPSWHLEHGTGGKLKPQHPKPERVITDEEFEAYLNEYAQRLYTNLHLEEYPHYCLIVKPLSLRNKDEETEVYLPIGNLYLLFCTKTKRDKNFYAALINNLVLVWLNTSWTVLLNELKDVNVTSAIYYPNLKPGMMEKFKTKEINSYAPCFYFDQYFGNENCRNILESEFAVMIPEVYSYFDKEPLKKNPLERLPTEVLKKIQNGGKKGLKLTNYENLLKQITLMRLFAVIATHVFDITIPTLHGIIETGYPKNYKRTFDNYFQYFHEGRWLTLGSNKKMEDDQSEFRACMLDCLSIYEKQLLKQGLDQILSLLKEGSNELARATSLLGQLQTPVFAKLG